MPGLLDDIGDIFSLPVPALGDTPIDEFIDFTALPGPEEKKTATVGLLKYLPFVLAGLFVFFVLRGTK